MKMGYRVVYKVDDPKVGHDDYKVETVEAAYDSFRVDHKEENVVYIRPLGPDDEKK